MESKNELNEIDIKIHMCYYFNETIEIEDFDPDNILIDEKSLKNILVHNSF